MHTHTEIIKATSHREAAIQVMVGTWNTETQQLISQTIVEVQRSETTTVYRAIWNEASGFSAANGIIAYVQVYDAELNLYQVTTQY